MLGRGQLFRATHALDVNLFRFAEFTTVVALSDGTTFLFDLEQWAVGVFA